MPTTYHLIQNPTTIVWLDIQFKCMDITSSENTLLGYKIFKLLPPSPLAPALPHSGVSRPTLKELVFSEQNFSTLEAQSWLIVLNLTTKGLRERSLKGVHPCDFHLAHFTPSPVNFLGNGIIFHSQSHSEAVGPRNKSFSAKCLNKHNIVIRW